MADPTGLALWPLSDVDAEDIQKEQLNCDKTYLCSNKKIKRWLKLLLLVLSDGILITFA
jgi:hypothetical protein